MTIGPAQNEESSGFGVARTRLPWRLNCLTGIMESSCTSIAERHGISRLPGSDIKTTGWGKLTPTEIGYVHIDSAELRLAQGKLNMFLAIDRVSKFTM